MTAATNDLVHLDIAGGVATVTLDSPANRNALSRALLADLRRQIDTALADERARLLVLTGTGPAFCAGADLKEQREANEQGEPTGARGLPDILSLLWHSPKPVIGRINGHARAGGVGLVAACDLAVAVETASFAVNEVRIGVAPAIVSVVLLPRLGLNHALRLFLTGEPFDAAEAARIGLVTEAAPAEELDARVGRYVSAILQGGPLALGHAKRLVRDVPALPMPEAFARMETLSAELFASAEAREGMRAFAERRPPSWTEAQ